MNSILTSKWTKAIVFVACLVPLALLVWRGLHDDLSADPVAFITHATGDWTLRFLVITLAITPLRKILHMPQLIRFRRMLGLFAFFYVCLHFTTWICSTSSLSGPRCGRTWKSAGSSLLAWRIGTWLIGRRGHSGAAAVRREAPVTTETS